MTRSWPRKAPALDNDNGIRPGDYVLCGYVSTDLYRQWEALKETGMRGDLAAIELGIKIDYMEPPVGGDPRERSM